MISSLFYKWGKWGTGRTCNFLCVTWLVNGGTGNWFLANSVRGCARNTSLYFLLKVIEAVSVHKDGRSISVEMAQSLSTTKDKLYLCDEKIVDVRSLRTKVNQGGLVTRLPGNGPHPEEGKKNAATFWLSELVNVFKMYWKAFTSPYADYKVLLLYYFIKTYESLFDMQKTLSGIIISVFSRWEKKNDHPVLLINSKAVARVWGQWCKLGSCYIDPDLSVTVTASYPMLVSAQVSHI